MIQLLFQKIKLYKNIISITLLGVVIGILIYQNNQIKGYKEQISISTNNTKVLFIENKNLKNKTQQLQLTAQQFKYFNDSINKKLDSVIKDNKIKLKTIKQLQYINSTTSKTDTIIFRDTLFRKDLKIDTLLVHPGYTLNLKLEYPNKIVTTPQFTNEQYIIFSDKRETINPPKKFFLARWFQKKHTIVTIDVINTNKYSDVKEKRFIEIIK